MSNDLVKIDKLVSVIINGDFTKEDRTRIFEIYENFNQKEKNEFEQKLKNNFGLVKKRLQKERLEVASRYKNVYEKQLRSLFENIGIMAMTEIYETSKCLNLELTSGVYFLRNLSNGLLKIGYAKDLPKRIKQISTAFNHIGYEDDLELVAVHLCFEPHLSIAENLFHTEFGKYRKKGEWFSITDQELKDFFFLCDFEGEWINDVLVSWGDYESFDFPKITRDYEININEMEYELFEELLPIMDNKHFMRTKVRNKLYKTIKAIEEENVFLYALDFDKFPNIKRVGVKATNSDKEFDFLGLKESKFNPVAIEKIIRNIKKILKR